MNPLLTRLFRSAAVFAPEGDAGGAPAPGPAANLYPAAAEAPVTEAPAEAAPESPAPAETPAVAEEKPADKPEEKPEPAKLEVKLPEGFEADAEQMATFTSLASEAGLSQEQSQKLADLYFAGVQSVAEANAKAFETTVNEWKGQLHALPDFATDEKREAAQVVIGRALDEYGSPEARQAFDASGIGWNPHVVSMFHKMAKALSEGGAVLPGRPAARTTQPSERLYPSS